MDENVTADLDDIAKANLAETQELASQTRTEEITEREWRFLRGWRALGPGWTMIAMPARDADFAQMETAARARGMNLLEMHGALAGALWIALYTYDSDEKSRQLVDGAHESVDLYRQFITETREEEPAP